jgi:hypothetical protein
MKPFSLKSRTYKKLGARDPGKWFMGFHLNQYLGAVVHACHPSYSRKPKMRISVQVGLSKKQDFISKTTRAKGARDWLKC